MLSIRSRCDEIFEAERTDLIRPKPLAAYTEAPVPAEVPAMPAPAAEPEAAPVPKTPAPVIMPEEVPAGVPAKTEEAAPESTEPEAAPAEAKETVFESLTPEENSSEA